MVDHACKVGQAVSVSCLGRVHDLEQAGSSCDQTEVREGAGRGLLVSEMIGCRFGDGFA